MNQKDLFKISIGDKVWNMTNMDSNQVYLSENYVSTNISRGEFVQENKPETSTLKIKIPIGHDLSQYLLTSLTEYTSSATIWTVIDGSPQVGFKGRLRNFIPGDAEMTIVLESIFSKLRRSGLNDRYYKSCRHTVYIGKCQLNLEDFATAGTVTTLADNVLTVAEAAAQPDGYFNGGIVKTSQNRFHYIESHVGSTIVIKRASYDLEQLYLSGPFGVSLYPGCNRTRSDCMSKFNNLLNYGGFDWIPDENPYTEGNIF